jgi:hypothetical protein
VTYGLSKCFDTFSSLSLFFFPFFLLQKIRQGNCAIENMIIVEVSNILRDCAKKCTAQNKQKKKLGKLQV